MDIWQIVVIVVLAALILVWVAVIAYNKGRVSGRLAAEQDLSGDEDTHSLFGDDAPVRPTERRLIEVLPEALIVTDRNGLVQYSSPGSVPFGLVSGDRLNSREVEDILTQAAADGGMREREVQLPVNRNSYPSSNGRGLEAGQSRPSNTLYLRVRIGDIGDDLYAIFINDMSEQRRFEAVRRDFVTNVSHELKTPAGAIALLAETVSAAATGEEGLELFTKGGIDLVLLDLMLPGIDGTALCRRIREQSRVPIIMLTAKSAEIDKVVGLEIGADDYVTKPYSFRELLARIRAVMRRNQATAQASGTVDDDIPLVCGDIAMQVGQHQVTVRGETVFFPLKEFELLEYLMQNKGRVMTRHQLIDRIWGSDYVGDTKTLDVHVKRVRSKIEEDPAHPKYLTTVRGLGYKIDTPAE